MGLLAGLSKRHSFLLDYEDRTDVLRDNLYLLLNRDKVQKSFLIGLLVPDGQTRAGSNDQAVSREREPDASR